MKTKSLFIAFCFVVGLVSCQVLLVLQELDYTENPVDIPNPDGDACRGRWQNIPLGLVFEINSPFSMIA